MYDSFIVNTGIINGQNLAGKRSDGTSDLVTLLELTRNDNEDILVEFL